MADLTISIVNYNTKDLLQQCLKSIFDSDSRFEFEVCVVDNNSLDGSPEMVRSEFPQVRLLANKENLGFGKGNNQVMRDCDSRYVLVLNPDVVVTLGTLEKMVAYLDDNKDIGILGCKLLNPDGSIQTSCRRYPNIKVLLFRVLGLSTLYPNSKILRRFMMLDEDRSRPMDVDWVIGSGMMIRGSALKNCGLFDEKYFMYYEDVDLCLRVWRNLRVQYFTQGEMLHHHRQQSHRVWRLGLRWIHFKSAFRYFRKHGLFPKRPKPTIS